MANSGGDNRVAQLQELLFHYAEKMRTIKPGVGNIFKTESSNDDLENKAWHFFHKVEASGYHRDRITDLTSKVRKDLIKMTSVETKGRSGGTEWRVTIQDRKILYEVDAFFAAGRSALDFLASVMSRYIRGKNADKIRKVVIFLENSPHPVAILINKNWTEWAKDFVDYRDYLLHRGVLPTPTVAHVKVANPKPSDPQVAEFARLMDERHAKPVVFPLPVKPNPKFRLTSEDMFGLNEPELPPGLIETSTTITFSTGEDVKGPSVKVSLGRSIGSKSIDIASESYLGKQSGQVRSVRYELAPGYVEADTLCQDLHKKLVGFGFDVFTQLSATGFIHVA